MKKTLFAVMSVMVAVLASACGEYAVDYDCAKEKEKTRCEGDVLYTCVGGEGHSYWEKEVCDGVCAKIMVDENGGISIDDNGVPTCVECDIKKAKKICERIDENTVRYSKCDKMVINGAEKIMIEKITCVSNECNEDRADEKCGCSNCVAGCEDDGKCIPVEGCKYNNPKTGACVCIDGVVNNPDGTCNCDKCVAGCEDDGKCIPVEGCKHNNPETGVCICKNGNTDAGDCANICIDKIGENKLFDKSDGSCMCSDKCKNGCNENGSCICLNKCKNGCNEDGSCACPCSEGCFDNGLCKVSNSCNEYRDCNEYEFCQTNKCYCGEENKCIQYDANGNHMKDSSEVGVDNKECWKDSDCAGAAPNGEEFCDSAMGYKCSVKCGKDEDCMEGYICRNSDGRCVSEYFTTVWDKSVRNDKVEFDIKKGKCNIDVYWDWKDGVVNIPAHYDDCPSKLSHNYAEDGSNKSDNTNVVIKIKGDLNDVRFYSNGCIKNVDKVGDEKCSDGYLCYLYDESKCSKLLEVKSFGLVGFLNDSNHGAFDSCVMLEKLSEIDIPDPNKLKSMRKMFFDTCSFNSSIENWDVSNVTIMEKMLDMPHCKYISELGDSHYCNGELGSCFGLAKFNQPLNRWNVSKVTNMSGMLEYLSNFNQPLDAWDVSNVTNMEAMFAGDYSFNQPLNSWDVSRVNNMVNMFYGMIDFNLDLSNWKLRKGVKVDNMFNGSGISSGDFCKMYKSWKKTNPDLSLSAFGYISLVNNLKVEDWAKACK